MKTTIIINEESFFKLNELFFSHTNKKGHIIYGNDVFNRVSDYEFDELRGKAHSIVRHPDMPKAVFKLFWQTLQKN